MRVVSTLPSATEICFALGVEPVGVSHECDYPPAAADLPRVNTCRIDPDTDSVGINEQVTEAAETGGVYELKADLLRDLDPDLVITQGVCDVCAVDRALVAEAVRDLDLDADLLSTDPHSLGDVFDDIRCIGGALGREERAESVVADLRERVAAIEKRVADVDDAERPRTLVLDWMEPPMVAGHWMPGLVERAGGEYGLADPGMHSEPTDWSAIRDFDPEVLLAAPCGFDLGQTLEHRRELTDREGWADLAAVREARVHAMDGHHYANRPGPRLVDTLEFLAALVHPDRFEAPPRDAVRSLAAPTTDA